MYFCCVLFAQNGAVYMRDLRELQGMGSALGKFTSELERKQKDFILYSSKTVHVSVHLSTKMVQRYK